jgi:hypothetical protein
MTKIQLFCPTISDFKTDVLAKDERRGIPHCNTTESHWFSWKTGANCLSGREVGFAKIQKMLLQLKNKVA